MQNGQTTLSEFDPFRIEPFRKVFDKITAREQFLGKTRADEIQEEHKEGREKRGLPGAEMQRSRKSFLQSPSDPSDLSG